jgi:hypothetical protein
MRVFLIALVACGASPPPEPPPRGATVLPPIRVEWRAEQGEGELVDVTVVVEGKAIALGPLAAGTESERGTPRTCAVRAHPVRTELACGDMASYYAAELRGDELVLLLVDDAGEHEVQRVSVMGDGLSVKPYALPD